jgi:hypothetical protein
MIRLWKKRAKRPAARNLYRRRQLAGASQAM